MKIFNKTALSVALATAGVFGISSIAHADAMTNGAGTPLVKLAATVATTGSLSNAPSIATDGLGQVLIFPYYTVRDGYKSLYNITNTSDKTLIVKVRFREHHNSRDALDFNLALSPYDVWTGWMEDRTTGPVLRTTDKSCTIPAIPAGGESLKLGGYTGNFDDTGSNDIDRTREGYVEVIAMGYSSESTNDLTAGAPDNIESAIKHVGGTPRDCGIFRTALTGSALSTADTTVANVSGKNGLPALTGIKSVENFVGLGFNDGASISALNPLKGNFSLIDADGGVGAGTEAIAIKDFFVRDSTNGAVGVADAAEGHLITAQTYPFFLEPTLASAEGLWNVDGLKTLEGAFRYTSVMNEWAENADTGAATDWAITFPTKSFHADRFCNQIQAGVSKFRTGTATLVGNNLEADAACTGNPVLATLAPFAKAFIETNTTTHTDDATAAVTVSYVMNDREEGRETAAGATFSPAPPGAVKSLRYEANVVTISGDATKSTLNAASPSVLDAATALSAKNGWIDTQMSATEQTVGGTDTTNTGIPVMGFIMKTRNQGDPGKAYGQIMGHAYK